jgi:hypothetical protein
MIFIPVLSVVTPAHATAPPGTFVTFDIPGGAFDIASDGIIPAGAITGTYFDGSENLGFLRAPDGRFITIAIPGAIDTFVGSPFNGGAGPPINSAEAITGFFRDASGAEHRFLRAPDGTFTRFDAPGAINGTGFVCCITPEGAVAGISFANFFGHGFLRAPNGTFTTFDPPGSRVTAPNGINPDSAITGFYVDANFNFHGFLRARDGTITTFDAPGAVNGTQPGGINPAGAIVGTYFDANFVGHGFLRASDGTFTTFDPPGSTAPFGTFPVVGVNPAGAIVGTYFGADFNFHGFLRAPDGTFSTVDPPGSASTNAGVINPAGVIAGSYSDANGVEHGFLFLPRPCC